METGEVREPSVRAKDIVNNKEFWLNVFKETNFADYINNRYSIGMGSIIGDDVSEKDGDTDE